MQPPTPNLKNPHRFLLEVAIESADEALCAKEAGADRFELCAALDVGGLTPALGVFHEIRINVGLPICVMIRPRPGGFDYSLRELKAMRRDIELFLAAGAEAVVFGALDTQFRVDQAACSELLRACGGRAAVFHRAFDLIAESSAALEAIIDLGFRRVLTSGGQKSCTRPPAIERIADLRRQADGRIEIMPGSGVRPESIADLLGHTRCRQVHGAFRSPITDAGLSELAVSFGFSVAGSGNRRSRTDASLVRRTRAALDALALP